MDNSFDVSSLVKDFDEANSFWIEQDVSDFEKSYQFLKTLAAIGKDVPETLYKLYADSTQVSKEVLYTVLSYFEGLELIEIQCDCVGNDKYYCEVPQHNQENVAYENGRKALLEKNNDYIITLEGITDIQDLYR